MVKPSQECPFCLVVQTLEGQKRILFYNELFVAFEDAKPRKPTHLIIAPRLHAPTLPQLYLRDPAAAEALLPYALEVAHRCGLGGYKIVMSVGQLGGQRVMHAHAHVMSDYRRK